LIPPFILKGPLKVFSFPTITISPNSYTQCGNGPPKIRDNFSIKLLTYGAKVQNHAKDTYNEAKTCQMASKRRY
jgi:hypothetical protein